MRSFVELWVLRQGPRQVEDPSNDQFHQRDRRGCKNFSDKKVNFCRHPKDSRSRMLSLPSAQMIGEKLPTSLVRFYRSRSVIVRARVACEGVLAARIIVDLYFRLV